MYKVMRQTRKPCFAFKILAAGRINRSSRPSASPARAASSPQRRSPASGPQGTVEQAYRTAFESIKPIDGVFVGMFPRLTDEVRENAEHMVRTLAKS
jgi:hypothetical protein